jgi:hypothetical protein
VIEQWHPVKRLEGFAEVSTAGCLRSVPRPHPMGGTRGGRVLKLAVSIHGYLFACIRHAGQKTNVYVHRAVAEAFIPNPNDLVNKRAVIAEKDGIERHYESLCAAGRDGFNVYNISSVLHGRRKTTGGFRWRFA